jgi:ribokinase
MRVSIGCIGDARARRRYAGGAPPAERRATRASTDRAEFRLPGRGIRQTGPVNDFKEHRIAVLGSANMDLVVRQPRLPKPGETMFGTDFSTVPGGKGLNQAVAAVRQGGSVDFIGAVGDDAYGRDLRNVLGTEGIGATGLTEVAAPTGTAHISVVDSGENSIVVVSGANAAVTRLTPAQESTIGQASFLVMQCELPVRALVAGIAVARTHGVFTVLTPAPVMPLPDGFLASVDLVVPNQIEAAELTGEADPVRAAELLSAGATWAIVTLGAEGCVVAFDGEVLGLALARPVHAVDTTAAGDTFVGALVARLAAVASPGAVTAAGITEERMIDAVRWATVASSISVTRPGATSSMPGLAEVAAILA